MRMFGFEEAWDRQQRDELEGEDGGVVGSAFEHDGPFSRCQVRHELECEHFLHEDSRERN